MPQPNIQDRRKVILAKIEARRKQYGGGSGGVAVHYGHQTPSVERISTGSPQLDYATCGGIPKGRWSRFYGGKSSGKSLTCWNVAREAQALGLSVVYCNIEKQYDPDFTAACGVDIKKLIIVEGSIIEEVGENIFDLLETEDVFILDSCSEGIAMQEAEGDFDDMFYAPGPRAWSKVFKKVQERFDHTKHTIIYTDHIRDSFDGNGVHPPGGKMMEHRSSLTLYFRMGTWLFRDLNDRLVEEAEAGITMSGNTEADGIEVQVRCEKNRVGRPFRVAKMRYDLDGAKLDTSWELAVAAGFLDADGLPAKRTKKPQIITKARGWFTLPDGSKVNGNNALARRLDEDEELRDLINEALRRGWRLHVGN